MRTGGHTGPPLRWELPPRRAVHPKRSRPSFRNEKKLCILLAYKLRKQIGVTAFDEWNCRAEVACVGADLRVRPQNRLGSGEDGRTHRSAPTVEASTAPSGSPEEKSTEFPKREKIAFYLHMNLESMASSWLVSSASVVEPAETSSRLLAVGRIIPPSRRSNAPNDWGGEGPHETSDLPCVGGRTGTITPYSPTHKGSINC